MYEYSQLRKLELHLLNFLNFHRGVATFKVSYRVLLNLLGLLLLFFNLFHVFIQSLELPVPVLLHQQFELLLLIGLLLIQPLLQLASELSDFATLQLLAENVQFLLARDGHRLGERDGLKLAFGCLTLLVALVAVNDDQIAVGHVSMIECEVLLA